MEDEDDQTREKERFVAEPSQMGRPRSDAPSRRDIILDAALSLFIEKGLGATGMGEVATRAGASKTTLYRLFPDVSALFSASVKRTIEHRRPAVEKALEHNDLEQALTDAAYEILSAMNDHAVELFRLVISEAGRRPDLAQGFYSELVASAVRPISERLQLNPRIPQADADMLALQFVGSFKEPLFYPRLMGIEPAADVCTIVRQSLIIVTGSSVCGFIEA
ncbi:MAG: TetR/AcrR family transcriptional regulator [Sulfitobacter sp.]